MFLSCPLIGAGGYGIVVQHHPLRVTKLFKNVDTLTTDEIQREAGLQITAHELLLKHIPEISVPKIWNVRQEIQSYNSKPYINGIEMDYLHPPSDYTEQVHILLGYHGDDLDESWGVTISEPVSESNPTRGYFASPEQLELIWEEEGSAMTIELLAFLMGCANRIMLNHGILPIDLEWVWSDGKPWILDFGLCEFGKKDPNVFLETKGLYGLASDFYIPHKGDRGYEQFMLGFSQST
jgi:hypothetical protein